MWRIENGRAVLVAYEIYRGPKNQYGKIPGVFGRSELGIEIVLSVAYQVYIVGLSFDKACLLMNFFQNHKRFSAAGRAEKVAALDDEIFDLCGAMWAAELPPSKGPEDDYRRLCNELVRLMLAQQLFTFVTAPRCRSPTAKRRRCRERTTNPSGTFASRRRPEIRAAPTKCRPALGVKRSS